jgi:hypothetical protein
LADYKADSNRQRPGSEEKNLLQVIAARHLLQVIAAGQVIAISPSTWGSKWPLGVLGYCGG